MFKLLLYVVLFYLLFRAVGSLVKNMLGIDNKNKSRAEKHWERNKQANDGKVHIVINKDSKNGKFGDSFKGGEYVDYEEVK